MPTAAGLASVLSAAQAAAAAVSAKPRGTGGAADGPPAKFNSAPPPTIQYNADVALALAANTVDDNSGKVRGGGGGQKGRLGQWGSGMSCVCQAKAGFQSGTGSGWPRGPQLCASGPTTTSSAHARNVNK